MISCSYDSARDDIKKKIDRTADSVDFIGTCSPTCLVFALFSRHLKSKESKDRHWWVHLSLDGAGDSFLIYHLLRWFPRLASGDVLGQNMQANLQGVICRVGVGGNEILFFLGLYFVIQSDNRVILYNNWAEWSFKMLHSSRYILCSPSPVKHIYSLNRLLWKMNFEPKPNLRWCRPNLCSNLAQICLNSLLA